MDPFADRGGVGPAEPQPWWDWASEEGAGLRGRAEDGSRQEEWEGNDEGLHMIYRNVR